MSIVNFNLTADRVAIATDTLAYTMPARKPHSLIVGKASTNGKFAHAHRGTNWISQRWSAGLDEVTLIPFDGVVDVVADWPCRHASESDAQEVYLFGQSAALGRMRAVRLRWTGGAADLTEFELGTYMNPAPIGMQTALPKVVTDDQLFRLSLAHFRATTGRGVPYCVGGVCHLTEVDRDGARQRIIGTFPDYLEMSLRFGDPNADAVNEFRGDLAQAAGE